MYIRNIKIEDHKKRNYFILKSSDFSINEIEDDSYISDNFIFGLCSCGTIILKINSHIYKITKNHLFIILPKHVFTLLSLSSNARFDLLLVSFGLIHKLPITPDVELLRKTSYKPYILLNKERHKDINDLYIILQHYQSDNKYSRQISETLINSIILIIASFFDSTENDEDIAFTRKEEVAHSFYKLLFEHTEPQHSVAFYADKLCITPKYLSHAVKSTSGHSAQEWLNEAILTEAKRYLKTTNMSVFQISEKLHFTNVSSFIRFFKKKTKSTPLEYRKK